MIFNQFSSWMRKDSVGLFSMETMSTKIPTNKGNHITSLSLSFWLGPSLFSSSISLSFVTNIMYQWFIFKGIWIIFCICYWMKNVEVIRTLIIIITNVKARLNNGFKYCCTLYVKITILNTLLITMQYVLHLLF